jgi:hypothetical protein
LSDKRVCIDCQWRGTVAEMLTAPNPFDPTDTIVGCPRCRQVETLRVACDEPECWREASCGTPTPNGYRSTCATHRPR